jgi:hypothetical protein
MNPDANGQQRVLWWMLGILGPTVLAVFTTLMNTAITTSQRASALEAHWQSIDRRIGRMEEKLDQLLEKRMKDEARP